MRDLDKAELLNKFENFTIIKDCISIIGSFAEGREYNDIDLLIRLNEPTGYIKRAIETRIKKMFPDDIADNFHFVWGDSEGAHDTFIPLYDLKLERIYPIKKIEMSESIISLAKSFLPFQSFKPLKSSAAPEKSLIYDIDNALENLADKLFTVDQQYYIEQKFDGFHGLIHKKDNKVKIYTEEQNDITSKLPTLASQAKELSDKDFIIDGELVPYINGQPQGRREMMKFVVGKEKISDENIKFFCWDIVYFDNISLHDTKLYERKKVLSSLNFKKTTNIKEVPTLLTRNKNELISAVNLVKKSPMSEGAMIKQFDSIYPPNATTDKWIKYRKVSILNLKILKINPISGSTKNFSIGIPIPQNKKHLIIPSYIEDNYLKLGNTFNTVLTANIGDIIEVAVQEVWRHKDNENRIRFSLHKPSVLKKATEVSTLIDLDKIAVRIGKEVQETSAEKKLKVKLLGTGPTSPVIGQGKNNRLQSSALIESNNKFILIDCTPSFEKQIANSPIDYILFTHAHHDAVGGIPQLQKYLKQPVPTYAESETIQKIKSEFKETSNLEFREIKPSDKFRIETLNITPFRLIHSIQPGFPTIGFRIDNLVYSEDLGELPEESEKIIDNSDIWILDAAMWFGKQIKGHLNVEQAIKLSNKKSKKVILTQAGHTYPPYDEAIKQIKEYTKNLETKYELAYDGMEFELSEFQLAEVPKEIEEKGEGGTREEAAAKFWQENWHKMYPKSGKGKFVYHHHWRGLDEETAKTAAEEQLLQTNHSLHSDIRLEGSDELFGYTIFLGTTESNKEKGGDKFVYESQHRDSPTKIEGHPKLKIPKGWLGIGKGKGDTSPPGGVGTTAEKWAKFFIYDSGTYELGIMREHMQEFFLNGEKLKGRMIVQYAPIAGTRKWLFDFPEDQAPYADSHDIEKIKSELKQKNQKYLVWAKPSMKPELIEIK